MHVLHDHGLKPFNEDSDDSGGVQDDVATSDEAEPEESMAPLPTHHWRPRPDRTTH